MRPRDPAPHPLRRRARRRLAALTAALSLLAALAAPPAGREAAAQPYPFRDPRLPLEARINDLLGRLTLDEKVAFLHQYQPAVPRLGIAPFKAGTEALHGLAWSNDASDNGTVVTATATVFPQAVGLASTWDPALVKRVGTAVGREARGYHALNPRVWGLNLWAPVVNLLRDPRWGRNEEGYSEDPYLTGVISTAYAGGLRGDHPTYLQTAPTLKHYLAYNNEVRRDTTSSNVPPRVLHEYDERAFQPAIAAGAATGVMASYNLINGRPAHVNPDLNEVVRRWARTPLFNVSDAFGPYNVAGSEDYYDTDPEAFAAILKAGLDSFTIDGPDRQPMIERIRSALDQGLLTEADIDTAVRHALSIRFRLGEFDPDGGPYARITPAVINSPEHQRLAREAAREAMVLLKNSRGALPLDPARTRRVAVVGPLANTLYTDWYSGAMPYKVTPLEGIRERLGPGATVTTSEGVDRIALREVATGRYVTAGSGPAGAPLAVTATEPGATTQFDVFDWGQGVLTLRSAANGKYVGFNWDTFVNDQEQPNGWFVQQQFKLERRPSGNYVIRYAGYEAAESWSEAFRTPYLTVQPDGTLDLGAATADEATEFAKEVIISGQASAVAAARGADAAVVVVGSMPFINGREAHDRTTMALAEGQAALVRAVLAANPRTILVLETSYPQTITWEQANVPAILWTTHAGQETGRALADVLFGDHNPAGRLTQTWYRSVDDLPGILEYDIIGADRTYLYFKGEPLYPFGHGLTYTTFSYRNLRLSSHSLRQGGAVTVAVDVTNTGRRAGDEVVQLYTHQRTSRDKVPLKALRGFQRVHLEPGQTRTVRFTLRAADLARWDVTRNRWVVEASVYDVMVGASSAGARQRAALRVRGERIPPRDLSRPTRAIDFDGSQGVELVDESRVRGDAVAGRAGAWIKFADVDLRSGAAALTARAARAAPGTAAVQVRLDDPVRGPLAGAAEVRSTGDKYAYETVSAPLRGAHGRRDVYLVFTGEFRLSTFTLR